MLVLVGAARRFHSRGAFRISLLLAAGLFFGFTHRSAMAAPDAGTPALSADDRRFLESLLGKGLVDPRGRRYVRFFSDPVVDDDGVVLWSSKSEQEGWLESGADPKNAKVQLWTGEEVALPHKYRFADLATSGDPPSKMTSVGSRVEEQLVPMLSRAAWLLCFRQEEQAAKWLSSARDVAASRGKVDLGALFEEEIAWVAFRDAVAAWQSGQDARALEVLGRLKKIGSSQMDRFGAGTHLLAELERRRSEGRFSRKPPSGTDEPKDRPIGERIAWLIRELDEVNALQLGEPGGVNLEDDWRVADLVEIGDAAVPALIDCLEHDERLTRSVHVWRSFHHSRQLLGVREAALTALMSILKVQLFVPEATGDDFSHHAAESAPRLARSLRDYWRRFGQYPFLRRQVEVLQDADVPEAYAVQAARIAAAPERVDAYFTTSVTREVWSGPGMGRRRTPSRRKLYALAGLEPMAVAQAILAAWRRTATADACKEPTKDRDKPTRCELRSSAEKDFAYAMVSLGERRIAGPLAAAANGSSRFAARARFAETACRLGDCTAIESLARDVAAGKVAQDFPAPFRVANGVVKAVIWGLYPIDPAIREAVDDVEELVLALNAVESAATRAALTALARPVHPLYPTLAYAALRPDDRPEWSPHVYRLKALRALLDDTSPTDATWSIEDGETWRIDADGDGGGDALPALLSRPSSRRARATETVADEAAAVLAELVPDLPPYHPLHVESSRLLEAVRAAIDRSKTWHVATARELARLGRDKTELVWLPGRSRHSD
jgi:hypothetical protein